MRSTCLRLSVGVLVLAGAGVAGCVRSHVSPEFRSPPGSVAVYRSEIPPTPVPACAAPTHRAAVVAQAPRPAPVVAAAPAPRPAPRPTDAPVAADPAPGPMTSGAAPSRSVVNATCPVMLGYPVDRAVTTVWQGRTIAFSDSSARARWDANPSLYSANLPRFPSAARIVTAPVAGGPLPKAAPRLSTSLMAIAAVPIVVGSPDGEDEPPAPETGEDEDCPGGNCRLPR